MNSYGNYLCSYSIDSSGIHTDKFILSGVVPDSSIEITTSSSKLIIKNKKEFNYGFRYIMIFGYF